MAWTDSEVTAYVLSKFGYPKRRVELDSTNLDNALKKALDKYGSIKPIFKRASLTALVGVQSYDLVALGKPYGKGIISVGVEPITSPQKVYTEFDYYRLRQPPYVDASEIVMDSMYYKELGYVTGTGFDWEFDWDTKKLLISPIPTRSHKIAYEYTFHPTKMSDIPEGYQGWVIDYTIAIAKEMLGRVRNKFQGVPGTEAQIQTDGADLIREGQEEQKNLEEELRKTVGSAAPPVKG